MKIKIIQLLYFCGFLLVNDSYSQMIKIDSVKDDNHYEMYNPEFKVRLVGKIYDNYLSNEFIRYKYFIKINDSISECSYSFNSYIDSIQIKLIKSDYSKSGDIIEYSFLNCYKIIVETSNGEQIYFKDNIEFQVGKPISLIKEEFKYKVIDGTYKNLCNSKVFKEFCWDKRRFYIVRIEDINNKTYYNGLVNITCP